MTEAVVIPEKFYAKQDATLLSVKRQKALKLHAYYA
jgi:hypothetical protein